MPLWGFSNGTKNTKRRKEKKRKKEEKNTKNRGHYVRRSKTACTATLGPIPKIVVTTFAAANRLHSDRTDHYYYG